MVSHQEQNEEAASKVERRTEEKKWSENGKGMCERNAVHLRVKGGKYLIL
jgi:hypothetical protein